MNKKIIGISLAMLFAAANSALAQTSVTMYGTVDAGIAYNRGSVEDGKVLSLESGQQSYSRIGFKGQEDLGSGMKAIFVLEQGIQIDTGNSGYKTLGNGIDGSFANYADLGNSGTFSSQAYVGLSGNFGTLKLGRQFSPLYEAHMAIDPFKNGFAANINNTFGAIAGNSLYQRMSNAVVYNTPDNLSGFNASLAYGFGEKAGDTTAGSQIGASVSYANGPLTIAYAYHHANNELLVQGDYVFNTHFIGAAYDFGMLKLHAAFDQSEVGDVFKNQDYLIGVTVPVGANSLFADYIHQKDKIRDDANTNQFAVGYTYNLSKRTNFYTAYTYVKNDANAFVSTEVEGNSVNTFQIGMRHSF